MSLEFDVCHSLWKPVYYSQDLMTGMGATGRRASRGWEFRTAMTSGASWYMQNDLQALQNRLHPLTTSPSSHYVSILSLRLQASAILSPRSAFILCIRIFQPEKHFYRLYVQMVKLSVCRRLNVYRGEVILRGLWWSCTPSLASHSNSESARHFV